MKKNNNKMTAKRKATKKTSTVLIIVAVVVAAAVLAGFGIHALVSRNDIEKVDVSPLLDSVQDMLDGGDSSTDAEDAEGIGNVEGSEDVSIEVSDEPVDGEDGVDAGKLVGYTGDLFDNNPNIYHGGTVPGADVYYEELPTISFPYAIGNTDLVVEQISSYSGYYIEDGSDQRVSNIAAIVLTNNGGDLDFVGIGIAQGDRNLAFSASQIPAGASVIIQEQDKASYAAGPYYSCTATTTESDGFDLAAGTVSVKDNGNNSFDVANLGEETIPEVKVYFKNYLPDEDVYVGGITYSATLTDIEPQTAVTVDSSHYDSQYSTIIDVVTEESQAGE